MPKDPAKAFALYLRAAKQGDADAQFNVGVSYTDGEGVEKDCVRARRWYERAAAQGHKSAMYNLGSVLEDECPAADPQESLRWLRKACDERLHGGACNNAANLYKYGTARHPALDPERGIPVEPEGSAARRRPLPVLARLRLLQWLRCGA